MALRDAKAEISLTISDDANIEPSNEYDDSGGNTRRDDAGTESLESLAQRIVNVNNDNAAACDSAESDSRANRQSNPSFDCLRTPLEILNPELACLLPTRRGSNENRDDTGTDEEMGFGEQNNSIRAMMNHVAGRSRFRFFDSGAGQNGDDSDSFSNFAERRAIPFTRSNNSNHNLLGLRSGMTTVRRADGCGSDPARCIEDLGENPLSEAYQAWRQDQLTKLERRQFLRSQETSAREREVEMEAEREEQRRLDQRLDEQILKLQREREKREKKEEEMKANLTKPESSRTQTKTKMETVSSGASQGLLGSSVKVDICLICMGRATRKKPLVKLPCRAKCQQNLVHKKCIFEWKEQQKGKGSCPLCRGKLDKIRYTPPDVLKSYNLTNFSFRKVFNLTPVPKKAGMIRCYLKVRNNPWWGSPFVYEFYLQKLCVKKYPHGPIPDASAPQNGDIFLMGAKKRNSVQSLFGYVTSFPFPSQIGIAGLNGANLSMSSTIDISMEKTDFERSLNNKNYLGFVQASSFTGLEYTVNALTYQISHDSVSSSVSGSNSIKIKSNANNSKGRERDSTTEYEFVTNENKNGNVAAPSSYLTKVRPGWLSRRKRRESSSAKNPNAASRQSQTELFSLGSTEVACIHYTQNRVGAESGPRKMKLLLPFVSLVNRNVAQKTILGANETLNTVTKSGSTGPSAGHSASSVAPATANDSRIENEGKQTTINDTETEPSPTAEKSKKEEDSFGLFSNIEDFSSDESSDSDSESNVANSKLSLTQFYKPENKQDNINKLLKKTKHTNAATLTTQFNLPQQYLEPDNIAALNSAHHLATTNTTGAENNGNKIRRFIFAKNKEPYWLERIQAFSLDFSGRVTLPSNKNFQIELDTDTNQDNIVLQFGKVVSAEDNSENVSVYTVDFKWPISPIQALGICLSSCDRKFACA